MSKKKFIYLFFYLFFVISNNFLLASSLGYYDNHNNSDYLSYTRMNDEFNITPLMNSAIENNSKATEIFIKSGANVNQKNIAGATALHLASRNNALESAKILLKYNANIDVKDDEGWTPLMRASLAGDEEMVKILVNAGAQKWLYNNLGDTAIVHSAMSDCLECAKILLENTNRNTTSFKMQCYRALRIANKKYNEELIQLLDCGENINTKDLYREKNDYVYDEKLEEDTQTNQSINKYTEQLENKENEEMKEYKEDKEDERINKIIYNFTGRKLSRKDINEGASNVYKENKIYTLKKDNISTQSQLNNNTNKKLVLKKQYSSSKNYKLISNDNNLNTNNTKYTLDEENINYKLVNQSNNLPKTDYNSKPISKQYNYKLENNTNLKQTQINKNQTEYKLTSPKDNKTKISKYKLNSK